MRGFLEFKGQSIRLDYDRSAPISSSRSGRIRSWLRKPTAENEAGHKNGNGTKPARRAKC